MYMMCLTLILSLFLFVVIRIIDAFHEHFAVVDLVCQRAFELKWLVSLTTSMFSSQILSSGASNMKS